LTATPICRICKGERLHEFLSLGPQPHCNNFLTAEQLDGKEPFYPLDVFFCETCALVQLGYAVPRETMFLNHPYVSGTTATLTRHFEALAGRIFRRYHLTSRSLVVDIGSNDGTWLKAFRRLGTRTLGVEPAERIAKLAVDSGIETELSFFGHDVAARIAAERGKADVITAAGVFFHVDDLDDFVAGVDALLAEDGVFVVQAMYLHDIVERSAFDSIYHEHLCYYSLGPLTKLFERFGMAIVDIERIDIHGGSFVIYVERAARARPEPTVDETLRHEEAAGLYSLDTYRRFAARTHDVREKLVRLLHEVKERGGSMAAYGAPARGNTLLNFCKIGPDILDYATEKNPFKFGLYTPGMHIPVVPEESARETPPDYYLVLAWNFFDEFVEKEREFRERGGRFVLPLPEPRVV